MHKHTNAQIRTSLGSTTGWSQMGHRGLGQGAGRKIGGNHYLHIFQSLISLGKCHTDASQPSFPPDHISCVAFLQQSDLAQIHPHLKMIPSSVTFSQCAAFVTTSLDLCVSCCDRLQGLTARSLVRSPLMVLYTLTTPTVTLVTAGCAGEFREGANWVC